MMSTTDGTTRWRDEPIVPPDYDDLYGLLKIAGLARERMVEFDWGFSREDLQHLRRAVYEWGTLDKGRYKCFDARVLAAIDKALGQTGTLLSLVEPKSAQSTDCSVSCVEDGDRFRLRGHASFDIVFGYGMAGVGQSIPGSVHLGPMAQATLANAVGTLGWDLQRLQEARFQSVRNKLYGMAPNYRNPTEAAAGGPELPVPVHFHGPYSALDDGDCPCLFTDEIASGIGVYFWAINIRGLDRPWYVGQTRRSFSERIREHIVGMLSGEYAIYDATKLAQGEHGLARGSVPGSWPDTLPGILRNYETLMPSIIALVRLIRFHVAPLSGDKHRYDQVEGAIGRYYKAHPSAELRDFFYQGLKVPAAIPHDNPIRLILSSDALLAGLPDQIPEPAR
jgi:hypothetical protein